MNELEILQPEESLESGESTERTEEQVLQDAAHEPGARVEETGTFEQAEAVESALGDAMGTAEQVGVSPIPVPMPKPAEGDLPTPCPDPKDLPQGSGAVEVAYSPNPGGAGDDSGWLGTGDDEGPPDVQMAESLGEPGPAGVVEIPEGIEFKPAGEDDGTVSRDDHPMVEDPELSETPKEKDGGEKYSISDEGDKPEPLPLEPPDPDPA